jgi:hypothetical protein
MARCCAVITGEGIYGTLILHQVLHSSAYLVLHFFMFDHSSRLKKKLQLALMEQSKD